MARTKQNQRPVSPVTASTRGGNPPSRMTVGLLTISALAAIWSVGMLTPAGRVAYVYLFFYAEFYAGVLTLVTLSLTVMAGVVATDRMVLQIPHRVLLQSAHRTIGIMAVVSLLLHIVTQVSMGSITVVDVLIPFVASNRVAFIGMGTMASYFLLSAFWIGIVRARFAGRGKPWMWRLLHSSAYLSWPIALTHGLNTGRPAATWVSLSYLGCVLLVAIALLVRLSVNLNRKKAWNATGTGSMKPVGKPAATAEPARRPSRRPDRANAVQVVPERAAPRRSAATAVLESGPPERSSRRGAEPGGGRSSSGRGDQDRTRRSSRDAQRERPGGPSRRSAEDSYRTERSRRSAGDDLPRERPRSTDDGYETRDRRRAAAPEPPPERARPVVREEFARERQRRAAEDDYPRERSRRSTADEYPAERSRRSADADYPPAPRRAAEDDHRRSDSDRPRRAAEPPYPTERSRRAAEPDYPVDSRRIPEGDARRAAPAPRRAATDDYADRGSARRGVDDYQRPEPARHPVDDYLATVSYPAPTREVDYPVADYLPGSAAGWSDGYGRDAAARTAAPPRLGPEPPRMAPDRTRPLGRHSVDDAYPAPTADVPGYDKAAPGYEKAAPGYEKAAPGYATTATGYDNPATYLPADDTPTLIDMASRRARRSSPESARSGGRAARRGRRTYEDNSDEMYWRRLRGEAQ